MPLIYQNKCFCILFILYRKSKQKIKVDRKTRQKSRTALRSIYVFQSIWRLSIKKRSFQSCYLSRFRKCMQQFNQHQFNMFPNQFPITSDEMGALMKVITLMKKKVEASIQINGYMTWLEKELNKNQDSNKVYSCKKCHMVFQKNRQLSAHQNKHRKQKIIVKQRIRKGQKSQKRTPRSSEIESKAEGDQDNSIEQDFKETEEKDFMDDYFQGVD